MHTPHWSENISQSPSKDPAIKRIALNLAQILYEYLPGALWYDVYRGKSAITKLDIKPYSTAYRSRGLNGLTTLLWQYEVAKDLLTVWWGNLRQETKQAIYDLFVLGQAPQWDNSELYYTTTLMVSGTLLWLLIRGTDIGKEYLRSYKTKQQKSQQ